MKLIVGLGNPGPKYDNTRHNVGFMMIDWLAEESGLKWQGEKFEAEFARGQVLGHECLLIKPQTFMNLSGRSVFQFVQYFKIEIKDIAVIHDDIDVPALKVRARESGGHGGNNGVRSMIDELGSNEFYRVKVGVGKPGDDIKMDMRSWVLGKITDGDLQTYKKEVYPEVVLRLKDFMRTKI